MILLAFVTPAGWFIVSLLVACVVILAITSISLAPDRDKSALKFEVTVGQVMVTVFFCTQVWWLVNLQMKIQEYNFHRQQVSADHAGRLSVLEIELGDLQRKVAYQEYKLMVYDTRIQRIEVWQTLVTIWYKSTSIWHFWQDLYWRINHWRWTGNFPHDITP